MNTVALSEKHVTRATVSTSSNQINLLKGINLFGMLIKNNIDITSSGAVPDCKQ